MFLPSNKAFLINNAPKFKYQPSLSKVKVQVMTTTEHCYYLTVLLNLLSRNRILCTLFIQTIQDNSTKIHINSALFQPTGLIHTAVRYTKQPFCPWTRHCLHKLQVREQIGCVIFEHTVTLVQILCLHMNTGLQQIWQSSANIYL